MILSRRVSLGGVQLHELHESIVIRSVDPGVPRENVTAADRMGGFGQRITGEHWQTLEASVSYAIDIPKTRLAERREVFDMVNTWALKKGWLWMNERPGKRMYVEKTVVPGSMDLRDWTDEYTITFRAYSVPFWQDATATTVKSKTLASGSVTAEIGGNVKGVIDVSFQNKSGKTIDNFWVQANGNRITMSNLGLGGSATLTISHTTTGLLQFKIGSTGVYTKYTGADDLYVNPGNTTVTFSADRAGILTVTNYGRWV